MASGTRLHSTTGFIVSVTGMLTGEFVAPVAVIVIVALYVSAVRPAMLTDRVTLSLFVPPVGLRLSHVALSLTDQFNVPPPIFAILNV